MPETVGDLLTEAATVVDAAPAEALVVFQRRYRQMVARSKCLRESLPFGSTVVGQAFYGIDLHGIVEILSFEIGGVPYGKARRPDIYGYAQGTLVWDSPGGLVVRSADSGTTQGFTVIPTPTSVVPMTLFVVSAAPIVTTATETAGGLVIDPDFIGPLLDGVIADFLRRQGEGDPATLEARFDAACEEQRQRAARRFRGSGPAQIRVQGINA